MTTSAQPYQHCLEANNGHLDRSRTLLQVTSRQPLEVIERRLQEAIEEHAYRLLARHDLRDVAQKRGVELGMECRVYAICQAEQAKYILDAEVGLAAALPCRIAVHGSSGTYTLTTLRPTALAEALGAVQAMAAAEEAEHSILSILRAAS